MIFGLEFRHNFGKSFSWALVLIIFIGLLMAFFPLMGDENILSLVQSFEENFSPQVATVLGFGYQLDLSNLTHYVPFIFQYLGVLFAIFAIQLGARSLSREQSAGTIEYLYGQPVQRGSILFGKFFGNLILYLGVCILSLLAALGFSYIFAPDANKTELMTILAWVGLALLAIGFIFLALGYLYSALSNRSSHAEGGSVTLALLILILWMVFTIMGGTLGLIGEYLPFGVFNPVAFSLGEAPQLVGIGVNLLGGIIFLLLAHLIYSTKELKF
ncbi:MAG: ABC transporter permease subunit [Tissierellia bacterium]|nr:ABC transporter permease subunit [Tissierellia bacterium]